MNGLAVLDEMHHREVLGIGTKRVCPRTRYAQGGSRLQDARQAMWIMDGKSTLVFEWCLSGWVES